MPDRRALQQFSRAQVIEDLLGRRPRRGLRTGPVLVNPAGGNPPGYYANVTSHAPTLTTWTGAQWGAIGAGGPTIAVGVGTVRSSTVDWAAAKSVGDRFAVHNPGGGVLFTGVSGPNGGIDTVSSWGIVGATVTLSLNSGSYNVTGTTVKDGTIIFNAVPAGSGTFTASAPGWVTQSWPVTTSYNGQGNMTISGPTGFGLLAPSPNPNPIVVTCFSSSDFDKRLGIPGLPITIVDPLGTTVLTANTDANGQVSYAPLLTGNYGVSVNVTGTRYNAQAGVFAPVNANGARQVQFRMLAPPPNFVYADAAASYTNPLKVSLNINDSGLGQTYTATWQRVSGVWQATVFYTFPGSNDCNATSVELNYVLSWVRGKLNLDLGMGQTNPVLFNGTVGGGGSAGGGGCPNGTFAHNVTLSTRLIKDFTEVSPPSFSATLTLPSNYLKRADAAFGKLYGNAPPTYTVTEPP